MRRTHREFLQAATGGQQPNAGFDQPDVALEVCDDPCRMHLEFTAAAQRQAAHCGDDWHQRVLDPLAGRLEVGDHGLEAGDVARLQQPEGAGETAAGSYGERLRGLDDAALVERFVEDVRGTGAGVDESALLREALEAERVAEVS